jgi:hypothetical protein
VMDWLEHFDPEAGFEDELPFDKERKNWLFFGDWFADLSLV